MLRRLFITNFFRFELSFLEHFQWSCHSRVDKFAVFFVFKPYYLRGASHLFHWKNERLSFFFALVHISHNKKDCMGEGG
jgi:hypothetical protein